MDICCSYNAMVDEIKTANFIISLDFELYWGVSNSKKISKYSENLDGVRVAMPKILELFKKYKISATWATVGMILFKDYHEWLDIRPKKYPKYTKLNSAYELDNLVRKYPKFFFAPDLVNEILKFPHQEIASHTFSHICCLEEGISNEDFISDLNILKTITEQKKIELKSIVFPRNQFNDNCLNEINILGYKTYRGNPKNFLYRNGHHPKGGFFSRIIRFLDHYLPLTNLIQDISYNNANSLLNIPATIFLRPYLKKLYFIEYFKIKRIKNLMTHAAKKKKVFHLWFHPHNFGTNLNDNLKNLENILIHYKKLNHEYGFESKNMFETYNSYIDNKLT